MFEYQEKGIFFAQVQRGLEEFASKELEKLGAKIVKPVFKGLYFSCSPETLYEIVYCARCISRVLAPLSSFTCHSDEKLYKNAQKIRWEKIFNPQQTFAVFSNVSHSRITHSHFAAQRLKDAVVDYFRRVKSKRPDIDTKFPDIWLNLHIENNRAVISLDLSGGSQHKRGYRQETVPAPLNETVAAAIIQISGWQGDRPLVDPMCGSGTILAEAMMNLANLPSGINRNKFGLFFMPGFSRTVWNRMQQRVQTNQRKINPSLIWGNDISRKAVTAARRNLSTLPQGREIQIRNQDYRALKNLRNSLIVSNLPYGKRLVSTDIELFYRQLGDFLKHHCQGSTVWLLCGTRELVKSIGLRTARKIPIFNGPLETRLIKLEIY